jgi:hypothetical protein
MKKKLTNQFVLKLDAPITIDEANACIEIIANGLGKHFDEDGDPLFRPEALNLVRAAFAKLTKGQRRKAVRK